MDKINPLDNLIGKRLTPIKHFLNRNNNKIRGDKV